MSLSNSNSESEDTETCQKVIQKLPRALCRPPPVVSATIDLRRHGLIQFQTAHAHSRRAPWRTGISGLATTVKRPGTISLVPPVKGDGNLRPRAHGRRRRGSSPSCPLQRATAILSLGLKVENLQPRAHGKGRRESSPSGPR